jgi:RNA-directed DNA polymerase
MISAMVHHFKNEVLEVDEIYKLKGYLGFANYIEPMFIARLKRKYGENVIMQIQKFIV